NVHEVFMVTTEEIEKSEDEWHIFLNITLLRIMKKNGLRKNYFNSFP
ncbi:8540_t:CDS:1, partial [Funneliformis caledonium]